MLRVLDKARGTPIRRAYINITRDMPAVWSAPLPLRSLAPSSRSLALSLMRTLAWLFELFWSHSARSAWSHTHIIPLFHADLDVTAHSHTEVTATRIHPPLSLEVVATCSCPHAPSRRRDLTRTHLQWLCIRVCVCVTH